MVHGTFGVLHAWSYGCTAREVDTIKSARVAPIISITRCKRFQRKMSLLSIKLLFTMIQ